MSAFLFKLLSIATAHAADKSILNLPTGALDPGAGTGVDALVARILDTLLAFGYPLAFISILVSSYVLISGSGKPDAYTKVRKNLLYLCTGTILIVFATIIVRFVVNAACTTPGGCFAK